MLKFITKTEYNAAVENGAETSLRRGVFPWHLKSVQDAMVMDFLKDKAGETIGEIGGGDTRILPELSKRNEVFNIEKFEGKDGGPDGELSFDGVRNMHCWVGDSEDVIEAETFDTVFSVSVVEHVPTANLPSFIEDCARILKPGGTMYHAVDLYVTDPDFRYANGLQLDLNMSRIKGYNHAFESGIFKPMGAVELKEKSDIRFRPDMISNPDNIMLTWNKVAPALADLRENAQSVTMLWAGTKA